MTDSGKVEYYNKYRPIEDYPKVTTDEYNLAILETIKITLETYDELINAVKNSDKDYEYELYLLHTDLCKVRDYVRDNCSDVEIVNTIIDIDMKIKNVFTKLENIYVENVNQFVIESKEPSTENVESSREDKPIAPSTHAVYPHTSPIIKRLSTAFNLG